MGTEVAIQPESIVGTAQIAEKGGSKGMGEVVIFSRGKDALFAVVC